MSRVVVLGAGVSGHTAALYLKKKLGSAHEIIVVSPNSKWNWIPSNIWVGVGRMTTKQVVFPLAPVYKRKKIDFRQALATGIWPEGDAQNASPFVEVKYTDPDKVGQIERISYDYLVNATGPKLNFEATPGLGPDNGFTSSVCTPSHATHAAKDFHQVIENLRAGIKQTIVVGTGHGTCTCEGAAFEYAFNVEHEIRQERLRHLAEVIYITNENELGDFGVGGMQFEKGDSQLTSQAWMESLFHERDVKAITQAAVTEVTPGVIHYTQLDGSKNTLSYDFAMLLPPFRGADLTAHNKAGEDITSQLFAPSGFLKVDADYTAKPFEEWSAADWPKTYQNPTYGNIFGVGIAFAPPHQISRPRQAPDGTMIAPAPPRTGMPSGVMGKLAAFSIVDMIKHGNQVATHHGSMAEMGAACIASTGTGFTTGTAAAIAMTPIVPDYSKFGSSGGRNPELTTGEIGLAGHWVKRMLHTMFLYKAKAYPLWYMIPE